MALNAFTASTSFVTKGKRLASWHLAQGTGAQTINFRNGGSGGAIQWQVLLAATSSASQAYHPQGAPVFVDGLYVEIVGTGFAQGNVDLI